MKKNSIKFNLRKYCSGIQFNLKTILLNFLLMILIFFHHFKIYLKWTTIIKMKNHFTHWKWIIINPKERMYSYWININTSWSHSTNGSEWLISLIKQINIILHWKANKIIWMTMNNDCCKCHTSKNYSRFAVKMLALQIKHMLQFCLKQLNSLPSSYILCVFLWNSKLS